jgi:hypothetical protein
MPKENLYYTYGCYDLKQTGLFIHDKMGHQRTFKQSFAYAEKEARRDKRLLFVVIFNEKTQTIIKRKWLLK